MRELYIIGKKDFQEDLLDDLSLIKGDIILLIYGNIKELRRAQKQAITEIQERITAVDKLHHTNDGINHLLKYICEKYSEYSLNSNEFKIVLCGDIAKNDLLKTLSSEEFNNKMNTPEEARFTNKKGKVISLGYTPKKKKSKEVTKDNTVEKLEIKDNDSSNDERKENVTNNENLCEQNINKKALSKEKSEGRTDKQFESFQKTTLEISKDNSSVKNDSNENKTIIENTKDKKTKNVERKENKLINSLGSVNIKSFEHQPSRPSRKEQNEVAHSTGVLKKNIEERKNLEKDILATEPLISTKKEVVDPELEARAEFLKQRLNIIAHEIEKIIKRCNVKDLDVTNDVAFTWIINIIQTNTIDEFNGHNRVDINLTEEEYASFKMTALDYYDLCNKIYGDRDNNE